MRSTHDGSTLIWLLLLLALYDDCRLRGQIKDLEKRNDGNRVIITAPCREN